MNKYSIENNESVVVVGNGPSACNSRHGPDIDLFDHVIRINNFELGMPDKIGLKTTLWAVNSGICRDNVKHDVILHCLAYGKPFNTNSEIQMPGFVVDMAKQQIKIRAQLMGVQKLRPSTGIAVIFWLLFDLQVPCVYLTGFDHFSKHSFRQHHYWENKAYGKPKEHSGEIEADIFYELEREGRIKYMDRHYAKAPVARRPLFFNCEWEKKKKMSAAKAFAIATLPRSGSNMLANWVSSQLIGEVGYVSGLNRMVHRRNDPGMFGKKENPARKCVATMEWYSPYQKIDIPWIDTSEFVPILLLRSPENWLASIKSHGTVVWRNNGPHRLIKCWQAYARRFLDPWPGQLSIYYDRFVRDSRYRDSVSQSIGIDVRTDDSLSKVSSRGGGSSFDKLKYDGAAHRMKVLERWKEFEKESWMLLSLKNDEVQKLHGQVQKNCEELLLNRF